MLRRCGVWKQFEAEKAAQFIQLANRSDTSLLFLHNTTGYMVGKAYEEAGMIKHGSKMIQAVTSATVPQITIYCGASFGAGNYGMCGRGFHPRFCFSWPNAKTAVMGPQQLAGVMSIVRRGGARAAGRAFDEEAHPAFRADVAPPQVTNDSYQVGENQTLTATAASRDCAATCRPSARSLSAFHSCAEFSWPRRSPRPGARAW